MEGEGFIFRGKAFVFGDNVDTDAIIHANWLTLTDEKEIASHCLEEVYPAFHTKASIGDILVAGDNFGCGSSREHAPVAIKGCGISCVVARSFSRLFYRNAINIGLPVIAAAELSGVTEGDDITVDCVTGSIRIGSSGGVAASECSGVGGDSADSVAREVPGEPLPGFMLDMLRCGGLYNYLENRLKEQGKL
jgi:3-isopropylmalate/(R)-2-methylmalate dehydratase small subunit